MNHLASAPSVILLDALGTLVALEPPAPRLRIELARRCGLEVTEAEAAQAIGAEISYYRAHLDDGRDPDALEDLRRRCAEVLRAALPPGARELALEDVRQALLGALRFRAFPDVGPALRAARDRGQRLVVLSNWDVSLHAVLEALELTPLLDAVLTSAEVGVRKPAPAIFERALALVGASAHEAVHVGDSLEEDVEGARRAGIEPVLVRRGVGPGATTGTGDSAAPPEGSPARPDGSPPPPGGAPALSGGAPALSGGATALSGGAPARLRTIASLAELADLALPGRPKV